MATVDYELCVYGYIKQYIQPLISQHIPVAIIDLCCTFYIPNYEILKFSCIWKSSDKDVVLSDDNKCATKTSKSGHVYALIDDTPIFNDIHCWRVQIKGGKRAWIMFAIGEYKPYDDRSFREVHGVSTCSQWFPWYPDKGVNTNNAKTDDWKTYDEYEVDILFNVDNGSLSICMVGNCKNYNQAKINGIQTNTKHGFVPNFNFYTGNVSLRVAKIPTDWYSQPKNIEFVV
eukprot:67623_1